MTSSYHVIITLMLEKHMENTVLYLIQQHAAEYKRIYFIHVRYHVTFKFNHLSYSFIFYEI